MGMNKALQPAIPKEELDEHIEKTREKLRRIAESYKSGYLTREERYRLFNTEIYEGFFKYLQSRQLKVYPYIKKNQHRFLEDHDLYKKNMEPDSQVEEPWLRYYEKSDSNTYIFYEASTADKISFFMLMDEFQIPVEYFREIDKWYDVQEQTTKKLIDYYERQVS